ncbi:MAG: sialate O-acetylesterase [Planctomycetes bacterium]|nr:sialate O-acetylesterase [Planctomycetota bacterium]
MSRSALFRSFALATCFLPRLAAEVKLPAILGDNAVLQADAPLPIWGTAAVGEEVTVTVAGQSQSTKAGADGHWQVKLAALKSGGPLELTVAGTNTIVLKNLLVGEVWVGSGQSNMEFALKNANDSAKEIAAADFPKIRLFTVTKKTSAEPLADCTGKWVECTPTNVPGFSAVAYFFGRELHQKLGVPVGLIHSSWGGTPAEAWTSRAALAGNDEFKDAAATWDKRLADLPKAQAKFEQELVAWKTAAAEAKAAGKPEPKKPRAPDGANSPNRPSSLYNGMLAPLIPYAIRGAIWYQGEANAGQPLKYRTLLPLMIGDWRQAWGEGDFPFYIVQLANYMARRPEPVDSSWAALREAQWLTTTKVKNTGLATIIDVGMADNIHPTDKQTVGHRLALNALALTYGKDNESSGPVFAAMKVDGAKAVLSFTHLGGGLVAKGGGALTGFAIAGADKHFVWATATIVGDTVVVTSDTVATPTAVRYAWADNPECHLYSKAELPAVPFRTDVP